MDFLEGESEEETPAPVSKKTCAKQQSKPLVSVCVVCVCVCVVCVCVCVCVYVCVCVVMHL